MMKKKFTIAILLLISLIAGFCYGYFVHRNHIFPYNIIKKVHMYNVYRKNMQWSIGIYSGSSPFSLEDPAIIDNPVIKARDVSDISAAFVADPFMLIRNDGYYVFFEVMNMKTLSGDIAYAKSKDGISWEYGKVILDEDFHLSYPCVYELNGNYYMIPESSEDMSVRLYKATSFPEEWVYVGNLLEGSAYYDPTVFYHHDKWWMFTSYPGNDVLDLFYSDSLEVGWKPHPMNPLVKKDKHRARPAGSIFKYENRLYRLAQDDYPYYGIEVFAIEILELSPTIYIENTDSAKLIVTKTGEGWNAAGMHHVDLHIVNDIWYSAVDGIRRRK